MAFLIAFPDNYPLPGKRPASSTAPSIIENPDGSLYASIGGSGGARIFGTILQVLLNLDWGLDASEAVEFSRLHDQLYPLILEADEDYPPESLEFLRRLGHNVTCQSWFRCQQSSRCTNSPKWPMSIG
jgi:gamma-glutamyltranspeptidase/glutathione hydrolase/leukotriene-C4 hydrolase